MKKIKLTSILLFVGSLGFSQVVNGGFESYNSLPTCPTNSATNTCITKVQTWNGLRSTYGTSCTYSNFNGCSSGVEYYNNAVGGTGSCVLINANGGTGYVYLDGAGFYPSGGAWNEYVYEQLGSNLTGGTDYIVTCYINVLSTWTTLGAWVVPTSVGSTATAILNNLRAQNPQPIAAGGNGNNWTQAKVKVTPGSTTSYYLVLGDPLNCNDGANSNVGKLLIDDVSIAVAPSCTANAGSAKTETTSCCPPGPCTGVTIGTASVTGQYYSWAPTTGLNNPNIAQPTASPCNTVTPTIYTVTVTGNLCSTATSTVQVTTVQYSGPSCCRIGNFSKQEIKSFSVYPNPTKDRFYVTLYGVPEYVKVMDMAGKVIYEAKDVEESEHQIDVSKYPKGMYIVTAKIGDKIEKQKLVLE